MKRADLILEGVLMLRKLCGIGCHTLEDDIEANTMCFEGMDDSAIIEWVDWLREESSKTAEQREAEAMARCEEMAARDAEAEYEERMARRNDRDEWDDLWADRARDCGAIF